MDKLIVWGLFDDGEMSYKKALEENFKNIFEIHSIGINNKKEKNYHKIDLSLINFNLIKQLSELPLPNIIIASPPCESWSIADNQQQMFKSLDNYGNWKVRNKKFYLIHNENCAPSMRRSFIQKEESRILGEATIGATIKIIKHFKPKVWIIENPRTSKIWKFQENHWDFWGYENIAYYSNYDKDFSLKPTIFKSNYLLNLKHKKTKSKQMKDISGYDLRSKIPNLLIVDIFTQIIKIIKNNQKENENLNIVEVPLFQI